MIGIIIYIITNLLNHLIDSLVFNIKVPQGFKDTKRNAIFINQCAKYVAQMMQ